MYGDNDVLKDILSENCVSKIMLTDILIKQEIKKCEQIKKD